MSTQPAVATAYIRSAAQSPTASLMGISISTLLGSADAATSTLAEYSAQAGAPGPVLHWHKESTEWFYILEGEVTFEVASQNRVARPGDFVHVPPRTLHRFWNSAPTRSRFLFGFNRPGMERYFDELFALVRSEPAWPPQDRTRLNQLAERYDTYSPDQL